MPSYLANRPLMHRGTYIPTDGPVDLTEQEAADLGTAVRLPGAPAPEAINTTITDTPANDNDGPVDLTEGEPRRRRTKSTTEE